MLDRRVLERDLATHQGVSRAGWAGPLAALAGQLTARRHSPTHTQTLMNADGA